MARSWSSRKTWSPWRSRQGPRGASLGARSPGGRASRRKKRPARPRSRKPATKARSPRHRMRRTAANLCRGFEGSFVRERRNYLLIMGAIGALLVGAVLLAVPGSPAYKKPTLGLDLQGGLEVVLRAVPQKGQTIDPQQMQVAQEVITRRTNATGLVSPNIAIQGGNEIVIQLAGVHDPAKAARTIGSTGQLQMFDFETSLVWPTVGANGQPAPLPSLYGLLKAVQKEANKGSPQAYYLFDTVEKKITTKVNGKKVTRTQTSHPVLQGPAKNPKELLRPYKNGQPPGTVVLKVPDQREPVSCKIATAGCLGAGSNGRSKNGE